MSISIIIPVHNSMKYLDECLESVLNQIEADDEIILIENGSIDDTPKKCKEYIQFYNNIKYIELGNVGVSIARNEGIKAASKEWITFLDSDDMLQDGALKIIRNSEKNADIIIGGYSREQISKKSVLKFTEIERDLLLKVVLQYAKYRRGLQGFAPIDNFNNWACWGKFYRRLLLQDNNVKFPEGVALSEDVAFCFQAYCCAQKIFIVNQAIYFYRENSLSVSQNYYPQLLENNEKLIENFEIYRGKFSLQTSFFNEFNCFYSGKAIEVALNLKSKKCSISKSEKKTAMANFCKIPAVSKAIEKTSYFHLIIGKKNSLIYKQMLFLLKNKLYCLI